MKRVNFLKSKLKSVSMMALAIGCLANVDSASADAPASNCWKPLFNKLQQFSDNFQREANKDIALNLCRGRNAYQLNSKHHANLRKCILSKQEDINEYIMFSDCLEELPIGSNLADEVLDNIYEGRSGRDEDCDEGHHRGANLPGEELGATESVIQSIALKAGSAPRHSLMQRISCRHYRGASLSDIPGLADRTDKTSAATTSVSKEENQLSAPSTTAL